MRFPYRWKTKWLELLIKLRRFRKKTNLRLQFIQDDLFDIDEVLRPYFRAFSALLMVFATQLLMAQRDRYYAPMEVLLYNGLLLILTYVVILLHSLVET